MVDTRIILAISSIRGVGPKSLMAIVNHMNTNNIAPKSAEELYCYLDEYGPARAKITEDTIYKAYSDAGYIIRESERQGINVLTYFDANYPEMLRRTMTEDGKIDPPLILYYKGNLDILEKPSIAVIGTREPTQEGVNAGLYLSSKIASLGYNIVSGLALGCDTMGHRGALNANGGTIAFLAHGLDTVYPPQNRSLALEILEKGGLLISEYPIGTPCNAYRLVARDRLQAGLALATLVVQTGVRGGTMHAVRSTLSSGKPVLTVRYNDTIMMHHNVMGNTALISDGAIPVSQNTNIEAFLNSLNHKKIFKEEQLTLF